MLKILIKSVIFLMVAIPVSFAQLVPIDEQELSETTGQAFITVDRLQTAKNVSNQTIDTTKITLGLDIKTSLNADLLDLGNYVRDGSAGSDIRINDFALGRIDATGTIVPFEISDPFIELAFDTDGAGTEHLIGLRIGFGGALGSLSGNIESLTGNIAVSLFGTGSQIAPNMNCSWYDPICNGAKGIVGGAWANSQFSGESYLVDSNGNLDPVRATMIGMQDGQTLSMPGSSSFSNFIVGFLQSNNCSLSGTQTCFPLTNFKTLEIGDNGDQSEGLFLSFQSENITWQDGDTSTTAQQGAFMNVPNGGINVSFQQAFDGIPRERTKYVDAYYD